MSEKMSMPSAHVRLTQEELEYDGAGLTSKDAMWLAISVGSFALLFTPIGYMAGMMIERPKLMTAVGAVTGAAFGGILWSQKYT